MNYVFGLLVFPKAPPTSSRDMERAGLEAELAAVAGELLAHDIRLVETDVGFLICGPRDDADVMPRRRALLAHARVLEKAQSLGAVLPMRFGTVVPDLAIFSRHLEGAADAIVDQLQRLEHRAEYSLRISFDRAAALDAVLKANPTLAAEHARLLTHPTPPRFEIAEFGRRIAEALERRRSDAQRAFLSSASATISEHVLDLPRDDAEIAHIHILARPQDLDSIVTRCLEAAIRTGFAPTAEPDIRIIGPSPAFNFVSLELPRLEVA